MEVNSLNCSVFIYLSAIDGLMLRFTRMNWCNGSTWYYVTFCGVLRYFVLRLDVGDCICEAQ